MPTSSSAARAFGVISSPSSAATPALSARQRSPLSSARALKIASAIGLRQTFAVQIKRICLGWFSVALPSLIYPLPSTPLVFHALPRTFFLETGLLSASPHYRGGRAHRSGRLGWGRWV